jgi:hypothetical protein
MKYLHNITGMAGFESAVLLALAAATFLLSGQGMSAEAMQFASGNF